MTRQVVTDVVEIIAKPESFWSLLMTSRHQVIGIYEAFRGTTTSVNVHPADLMRPCVVSGATAFIVAHNHPSGDPEPSNADMDMTKRLVKAGEVMGIPLLDHLVIGAGEQYVSFADRMLI